MRMSKQKVRKVIDRDIVWFNQDGYPAVDIFFEELELPPDAIIEIVAYYEKEEAKND